MNNKKLYFLMIGALVSVIVMIGSLACSKGKGNTNNEGQPAVSASPEATREPGATATPTSTSTPTPTYTPTPIPTVPAAPQAVDTDTNSITVLVNRDYMLSESYKPKDLVSLEIPCDYDDPKADKHKMSRVAADALKELYEAALLDDMHLIAVSGYRSIDRQYELYAQYYIKQGIAYTGWYSAPPGGSEHHTGLAIDMSCQSLHSELTEKFASTAEGKWLAENAWKYGYIIRYPKEKEDVTGYAYEPWHIRYVGVPLAYYLYCNNMTLDEYYGVSCSYTREYLSEHLFIQTDTLKFYKRFAEVMLGKLIYKDELPVPGTPGIIIDPEITEAPEPTEAPDSTPTPTPEREASDVLLHPDNGRPMLIPMLKDKKGNTVKDSDKKIIYCPLLYNAYGSYIPDGDSNFFVSLKPSFDADGKVIIEENGEVCWNYPLIDGDGSFVRDEKGNIVYRELVTDAEGAPFINIYGATVQKYPKRDADGYIQRDENGAILWFEPLTDETTGEFIADENGNLEWDDEWLDAFMYEMFAESYEGYTPDNYPN